MSDLSLKDSAKSDSTRGSRLVRDSMQSDYITPTSSVDCAKSDDTSGRPSFLTQQSSSDRSENKAITVSVKTKSPVKEPPINVVSLLQSGHTLRYCVSFFVADSMGLSSFKFLWWAPKDMCVTQQIA